MKSFAAILTLGFLTAVQAQQQCLSLVSKIPTCAVKCIDDAASSAGCTSPTDLACQCKNTDKINSAALSCVLGACGASQGLQVQSAAAAVCQCVSSAGPAAASSTPASAPASSQVSKAASTTTKALSSASATATSPRYPVTQATDGQLQVGTGVASQGVAPTASTTPFTGSGATFSASMFSIVLTLFGVIAIA